MAVSPPVQQSQSQPISSPSPSPSLSQSPEKEATNANLHHPLPDLQSLQGAYVGNISRLEEHAERMSEAGSDLNEEIRKLHTELKASDSRRSSLRSLGFPGDELARVHTGRSRNVSISSHANSVIDTNGPARWGGYSPGGYVTSPVGSLRSGSWSNAPPATVQRHRSGSKASRLGQVVHPEQVQEEREDPSSPSSIMVTPIEHRQQDLQSQPPQRQVSSFTRKYEAIANEIRDEIRNSVSLDRPVDMDQYSHQYDHDHDRYDDGHHEPYPQYDLPDRPPTAASTDTTHQARTLWQDFDGTHAPDTVPEEEEPASPHATRSRNSSFMMGDVQHQPPQGAPPPDDGMVFYPAPVPRMLNLPKRLSQLPPSDVAARRRTQVLDQMQNENRKSAPWLDGPEPPPKNRKSRQSFAGLPAALRASAFFDQQAPAQEFEVKGESAEDTLDNILEASARAPVSAFTDHPFTGRVGNEVYGPEHKRKSTKLSLNDPVIVEPSRRRSSFNILDTDNNSSGKRLNKLKKRNSSADMNILIARAAESRMSLGAELDEPDQHARGPNDHDAQSRRSSFDEHHDHDRDAEFEDEALDDKEEEEEEEQYFGAPTTLLAELQLRKAKQKERNMNYVTMVEEGKITSHRTLLDLNDDAEREHQRRLKKKVQLAWEAQDEEDSDEDVPLGVLYKQPQKNDWDRPLGLIAQRELEDSEPLSRRRARLTGMPSNRRTATLGAYDSQTNLDIPRVVTPQPESEEEEHVGETLGERMRRLKDKQMLEAALGDDVRKSTVSGDFAAEMLSKLGVDDSPKASKDAPSGSPAPPEDGEEETLGQRRARLKAEAEARGDVLNPGERPALKSKMSLADVLSANPYDDHHQARKVSNEQLMSHLPAGSLLHQNAIAEEKRKAQRLTQNMRASSYGMPGAEALVRGVGSINSKDDENVPLAHKIQAYKDRMAGLGPMDPQQQQQQQRAQSMMFPTNPMGMNPALNMSQPSMPMMGMNMPMQMPMQMPMAMNPMQMQMQPNMMAMNMNMNMNMSGNRQSSLPMQMGMPMMQGMNMPMNGMQMPMNMQMGMGMGMGPGQDMMLPPMNTQQRSNIEGWMKGIR